MSNRRRKKSSETSKRLAWWAVTVASLTVLSSYLLAAFGREPVAELSTAVFGSCIAYLVTYAAKSLGEKVSRNRHNLDDDGNPRDDFTETFREVNDILKGG